MNEIQKKDISSSATKSIVNCNHKTDSSKKAKSESVAQWISSSCFNGDEDDESILSDSTAPSSSVVDSDYDIGSLSLQDGHDSRKMSLTSSSNNTTSFHSSSEVLQHIFNKDTSIQTVGNVHIENSSNVHIGNVTYITGPIHITNSNEDYITKIINSNTKTISTNDTSAKKESEVSPAQNEEEIAAREESCRDDAFLGNNISRRLADNVLHIVERRRWLAQKPMDPHQSITKPVELVIISHSATEMATTMSENIFLIRNIQFFHIESCRWNDIAYNFMIGNDGNVYEGRGWGVVGAHTRGYNQTSVGICFVGCFMRELPPAISLQACKKIIQKGVEGGYIVPDYKLIAHCQCSATESPGRKLFEELQTWDHFSQEFT